MMVAEGRLNFTLGIGSHVGGELARAPDTQRSRSYCRGFSDETGLELTARRALKS